MTVNCVFWVIAIHGLCGWFSIVPCGVVCFGGGWFGDLLYACACCDLVLVSGDGALFGVGLVMMFVLYALDLSLRVYVLSVVV